MSILWTGLSILHAILTGYILYSPSLSTFLDHYVKTCPDGGDYLPLGIKGIDYILCIITPFFKATIDSDFGLFSYYFVISLFISSFIYCSIESTRPNSSYFIKYPFLVFMIGQFVGISVVFPLFYLTTYFLTKNSGRVAAERVFVVGGCAWAVVVLSALVPLGATGIV